MRKGMTLFGTVLLIFALAGCSSPTTSDSGKDTGKEPMGPISVGSKIDTEGELLSSVIKIALEDAGYTVQDKSQTGTTDVVRKALLSGEIDIYPEYTGSGLIFFEGQDPAVYKDPQKGYEAVQALDLEQNNIVWLAPAKANNTWLIALKKDFAASEKLATMSDLAAYVTSGKTVKMAGSDEFFNNPDAMPAFVQTYGFRFAEDQKVVFSGGNTAQTEKAVADGTDGVNFGMAYGTDGALADLGLTVLEDDKGAQLVYWPTPLIRGATLDKYPGIKDVLDSVFASFDIAKLQELNARVQVNGEAADTVARDYLEANGLIGK
ncbi:MAG: ABC transporter substrate-binding protein [Coriobacteriia bacterium]|nr:ABC transporter substrate-binding protein [Coriobacteriia bacterium]